MNCAEVLGKMGFECEQLSNDVLRIWSPFTYGIDGEAIGLYVERTNAGYRVSDGAEALRHAEAMGVNLTKNRLDALSAIAGNLAVVSDGGEIYASADGRTLTEAIAAVLNAANAVSHLEFGWLRRMYTDTFTAEVGEKLEQSVPQKLKRNITVTGASGHQIEIPFSVQAPDAEIYIQPVAYGEGRVNWDLVYRGFGKMIDLKNAGAEHKQRVVVIDDRGAADDLEQAITFLSGAASVVRFRGFDHWLKRLAA